MVLAENLEAIINKSPIVFCVWKNMREYPLMYISENIRQFGYEKNDFLLKKINFSDIIHPLDKQRVSEEIEKYYLSNIDEFVQEYRIFSKSGTIHWVHNRTLVNRDDRNSVISYQSAMLDFTKRIEIEQKIRESEEIFRSFTENTFIGYAIVQENEIIYANNAVSDITGYTENEILNWTPKDYIGIVHPDYKSLILDRLAKHKESTKQPATYTEFPIFRKDGTIAWLFTNEKAFIYQDKPAILTIFIDITERKISEEKLIESENKYKEAFENENFYKDIFVHDINNILQGILTSVEIARVQLNNVPLSDELTNSFNEIEYHIYRAARLAKNVKKFSDVSRQDEEMCKINVLIFLKKKIKTYTSLLEDKDIDISITANDEEFNVRVNGFFEDIFTNIILNAIAYNDHSKIIIEICLLKEIIKDQKFIRIEICDNGQGVPDKRKNTIFERDRRIDKSLMGIGLGLSLVKRIVQSYGGSITVQDRVQGNYLEGSCFIILLPASLE